MNACQRVLYTGRVQGVGFRYTARSMAQGFAVTGFVRNLPDGQVELVAEGDAAEVTRFLEALAREMDSYIERQAIEETASPGLTEFVIRR